MAFNQKNPPWQRNAGQNLINNLVGFPQNQPVFNQSMGMQQQNMSSMISQMGGGGNMGMPQNQIFSQTVQYPASRNVNSIAFAQNPQSQGSSKFNPSSRVFSGTGHVTKVQNDFGFIDEEVFFHKNVCVKGSNPKVGDRVLVEAAYNQNMPFKWNATRVQVLQSHSSSSTSSRTHSMGYSAVPGSAESSRSQSGRNRYSPNRKSPERHGNNRASTRDSRKDTEYNNDVERRRRRDEREKDRSYRDKRDRESRDKSSERSRDKTRDGSRERSRSREKSRDRSAGRKSSPKRRKTRAIPRYMVQIPKTSLAQIHADVLELKRRYANLYIPSDFFTTNIRWIDAFPPNAPFSIQKPCAFHVMHKEVEPLEPDNITSEPADVDYLYSAKVMLISTPALSEMYKKCFSNSEEMRDRYDDEREYIHPTRLISFLVGLRGKNETMAIGGPWSPSVDGEDPQSNPEVLIKTAIRSCKGLTGIDLSKCTSWYRFVELYYRRSETYSKGRLIPARIETVVIFLPDVRSCQPNRLEWDALQTKYKLHLESVIISHNSETVEDSSVADKKPSETSTEIIEIKNVDETPEKEADAVKNSAEADAVPEDITMADSEAEVSANPGAAEDDAAVAAEDNEKDENDGDVKNEPTNADLLDPKSMKVAELKRELGARNLPTKGIKSQLLARLVKALKQENDEKKEDVEEVVPPNDEDEEFETIDNVDMSEVTVIDEYDSTKVDEKSEEAEAAKKEVKKKLDEKDIQLLERRYSLPEHPHIIVNPSKVAKSGKFDCTVMSLSLLLDYRPEDSKEHSFEVSLFAELFNEMLMRDFGFNIYKSLYKFCEKKEEKERKEAEEAKEEERKAKEEEKKAAEEAKEEIPVGEEKAEKDNGKEKEKEKEDDKEVKESGKEKEKEREKEKEKEKEKDKEKEKEKVKEKEKDKNDDKDKREKDRVRGERDRKRPRTDEKPDEERRKEKEAKEKEKEKARPQYVTFDQNLLLSFVYFDISHCGYIFEKDLEELFYTLGLNLARSQTRKLASAAITRDSLYYRKLTDKIKEKAPVEGEEPIEIKDDPIVEVSDDDLSSIAKGNNDYMEVVKELSKTFTSADAEISEGPPAKKRKADAINGPTSETKNGMIMHNGCLINIVNLMEQMKRSEKAREETEQLLIDLRKQNTDLLYNNKKSDSKIKDLSGDIKSFTRKLTDTERDLREITRKCNDYYSTLTSIHDRVHPYFHKNEKRSSSITSKSGSSRDKKKEETMKEKENGVKDEADKNAKVKEEAAGNNDADKKDKKDAVKKEADEKVSTAKETPENKGDEKKKEVEEKVEEGEEEEK